MKQQPIDKLRTYARTYHQAHIVDNGFCTWLCQNEPKVLAAIAQKAILLGMQLTFCKPNFLHLTY